ncbi:MAG: BolA family protein [bacterium]
MNPEEVKILIEAGLNDCSATVTNDGTKYYATIISPDFAGMNTLKKHQAVYRTVNEHITSGAIHALTIKTYTPEEWAAQEG